MRKFISAYKNVVKRTDNPNEINRLLELGFTEVIVPVENKTESKPEKKVEKKGEKKNGRNKTTT